MSLIGSVRGWWKQRPLWQRLLFDAVLIAGVFYAVHWYQTRDLAKGILPVVIARTLDDQPVDVTRLPRPLLVHFWATWCPVCRAEEDNIQSISEDYAVLGIALEDSPPESIRSYMSEHGLTFPTVQDADGGIGRRFGVKGVPTSFVVDAEDRIRFVEMGYTTEWGMRLRLWWAGRAVANGE